MTNAWQVMYRERGESPPAEVLEPEVGTMASKPMSLGPDLLVGLHDQDGNVDDVYISEKGREGEGGKAYGTVEQKVAFRSLEMDQPGYVAEPGGMVGGASDIVVESAYGVFEDEMKYYEEEDVRAPAVRGADPQKSLTFQGWIDWKNKMTDQERMQTEEESRADEAEWQSEEEGGGLLESPGAALEEAVE